MLSIGLVFRMIKEQSRQHEKLPATMIFTGCAMIDDVSECAHAFSRIDHGIIIVNGIKSRSGFLQTDSNFLQDDEISMFYHDNSSGGQCIADMKWYNINLYNDYDCDSHMTPSEMHFLNTNSDETYAEDIVDNMNSLHSDSIDDIPLDMNNQIVQTNDVDMLDGSCISWMTPS